MQKSAGNGCALCTANSWTSIIQRSYWQAQNWNFLWGDVVCTEMDPRVLACVEPDYVSRDEVLKVHFPFSHFTLVK